MKYLQNIKIRGCNRGVILINVLIFAAIAVTVTIALVNWGAQTLKTVRTLTQREQAFQIAEAGIEYYRWHLAHFPSDYSDGTTTAQPYVHEFDDALGNNVGKFSLTITPPNVGSTLVTIKSTGTLTSDPTISRSIQATLGKPSFARYAFVANDFMRFGAGTIVNGPIQVNNGVHFDGLAYNTVASSLTTTTDPDSDKYGNGKEWGVFTNLTTFDPQPNTPLPNRSDVFAAGRQLSVPNISFSGITTDLNTLQTLAGAIGTTYDISSSGASGYDIQFSYDSVNATTTYKLYKVTSVTATPPGCNNDLSQTNWGTWSVGAETPYPSAGNNTFHLPANGVIFVNDNVWVSGTVGHARVTIAAGKLPPPSTPPDIIINKNLLYSFKNGTDVIGLIAQGNISVGMVSSSTYEVDAALVAQNGRVGRFYYTPYTYSTSHGHRTFTGCGTGGTDTLSGTDYSDMNTINIYGMIASFIRYGFAYTGSRPDCSNVGNGYCNRNVTYDPNLLYGPPPSFPLSSSQYVPLTWQEVSQ